MRLSPFLFVAVAAALALGDVAFAQQFPPRPPRDINQPSLPPGPQDNDDDDDVLRPPPPLERPRQVRPPAGVESAPLPPPGQIGQPPQQPLPGQIAQPPQQPRQQQGVAPLPQQQGVAPILAPPLPRGGVPPNQAKQRPDQRQQQPAYDSEVKVEQPPEQKIANPTATFSGLDKITGRIITFDVAINETVQFGPLQVTPRVCYTRPATETQNTTGFIEVDEITLKSEIRRIFTGWMFASSPGLHAVEHPIYDVWLIDCKTTPPAIAASGGKQ